MVIIDGPSVSQVAKKAGEVAKKTGELSRTAAELRSDPGDAEEYADAFQEAFNANAETLRRYANDRTDADDAAVAIGFADRRGGRSERYLVASADGTTGDFEEARVVGLERFEGLDRSVDRRVDVDWYLGRNAADELETFVGKFAERNADPSEGYVATIAAKYGDSVEGSLADELIERFGGS